MAKIAILYASSEGQTGRIAEHVASVSRAMAHSTDCIQVGQLAADFELADFQAVIIGASVHLGRHQTSIRDFVKANRDTLQQLPSAFFSVSLSASSPHSKDQQMAASYVEQFIQQTGWQPDETATFAGALKTQEYSWIKRFLMYRVVRHAATVVTTSTRDATQDHEFTSWAAVTAFTRRFLDRIAATGSDP